MKPRALYGVAAGVLLLAGLASLMTTQAQEPDRWLHVRVEEKNEKGEVVRVNLPLTLAEKVLPAVTVNKLRNGRIKLNEMNVHEVDVHAILEAVKTTADGEFVTVDSTRQNVRVSKKGGYLLVQVRERKGATEAEHTIVDVKMPMTVVEALLSGGKDELDLVAAIRVLRSHGDTELVSVRDRKTTVRVWVDSKNTSD